MRSACARRPFKIMSIFCQKPAKSSQFFASNIAFFSIFQNLQDFAKRCKNSANFLESSVKLKNFAFFEIFRKFEISKIFSFLQNSVKFCKILQICLREDDFLLQLEKC